MAAVKGVFDMVRSSGDTVLKSDGSGGGGYWSPKSWFNDPYALLDSMGLGYKSHPSSLSYETLNQMGEKNVVVTAIVQTRINQVASFCQPQRNKYSIGFKVQHRDNKRKLTYGEKQYAKELESNVTNLGPDRDKERGSFETFARKTIRDRLVYDQMCVEKIPKRSGKPHSMWALDAATIRVATPSNKRGGPLNKHEQRVKPSYVQVVDGTIINEYTRDELMFRVANPRTNIKVQGYGFSELEMLINTITSHLWAEEWNRKVFSQGSTIKGLLNIKGNINAQHLEAFKRQWITQVSGVTNAWKTPVVNSDDVQWIPLQPSNNDMGYQQWMEYLIKIACAVYLVDPAEINFDTRAGVGNSPMFMTTNEAQQKMSKDRGLQPLLRFFQNAINEEYIWEIDDNFEFLFVGLDSQSEAQAIELRMKEGQSYKTLNEIRQEADELPPVEGGDMVMNPTFVGWKQQQQAAQQQAAAGAAGGMPGGAPGGGAPAPGAGGVPPGQGREMFENLFNQGGKPGKPKQFGSAERNFGGRIERDMETPPAKPSPDDDQNTDEEHLSREDGSDIWEESIHASDSYEDDLQKAMDAFNDLG